MTTTPATPATVRRRPSIGRRLDNMVLRWQGRLDSDAADRLVPWAAAAGLFVFLAALALARYRALEQPPSLAGWVQALWLLQEGVEPDVEVLGGNAFASHLSIIAAPVAWIGRLLPIGVLLLLLQSFALASTVVPLWRLARRVCLLRVGAAGALVVAYAFHPAVHRLNLAGFHPEVFALPAFVGLAHVALTGGRWRLVLHVAIVLACRADLGLLVSGTGVLLVVTGKRRHAGAVLAVVGLAYAVVGVLIVQRNLAGGSLPGLEHYAAYGDTVPGVIWGMLTSPLEVLFDLLSRENFIYAVGMLAPLLFLPGLSPGWLAAGAPLIGLYLVADPGAQPPGNDVAVLAVLVVAATFGLARLGRMSVERVLVDSRISAALIVAALVFFVRDAPSNPYEQPWAWGARDAVDGARLRAADRVADDSAVCASPSVLARLAERPELHQFDPDADEEPDERCQRYLVVADDHPGWEPRDRAVFAARLEEAGYRVESEEVGVTLWRASAPAR